MKVALIKLGIYTVYCTHVCACQWLSFSIHQIDNIKPRIKRALKWVYILYKCICVHASVLVHVCTQVCAGTARTHCRHCACFNAGMDQSRKTYICTCKCVHMYRCLSLHTCINVGVNQVRYLLLEELGGVLYNVCVGGVDKGEGVNHFLNTVQLQHFAQLRKQLG